MPGRSLHQQLQAALTGLVFAQSEKYEVIHSLILDGRVGLNIWSPTWHG
jgi:hypothetical protein